MTGVILVVSLIFVGLMGLILRRNLFFIALNCVTCFLGILLLAIPFSGAEQIADLDFNLLVLLLLFGVHWLLFCGVIVFVYRHRGILQLDALRDLRG